MDMVTIIRRKKEEEISVNDFIDMMSRLLNWIGHTYSREEVAEVIDNILYKGEVDKSKSAYYTILNYLPEKEIGKFKTVNR
jgi:hypothetical protein